MPTFLVRLEGRTYHDTRDFDYFEMEVPADKVRDYDWIETMALQRSSMNVHSKTVTAAIPKQGVGFWPREGSRMAKSVCRDGALIGSLVKGAPGAFAFAYHAPNDPTRPISSHQLPAETWAEAEDLARASLELLY